MANQREFIRMAPLVSGATILNPVRMFGAQRNMTAAYFRLHPFKYFPIYRSRC